MLDEKSKERVALWHDAKTTGLYLKDDRGHTRVETALFPHGGGFALHGPGSRGAAVMTFMKGRREIRFYNDSGKVTDRFPEKAKSETGQAP